MLSGCLFVLLSLSFLDLASSQSIPVTSGNSIFTQTGPFTVSATYPQPATGCALNKQTSSDASACAPVAATNGTWRQARATFYGGPESYLSNFADRGPPPEYGFGTSVFGSCGFTSQNGTEAVTEEDVPVADNMVAALANTATDYPGSCGRCYEVKCQTGLVIANYTGPASNPTSAAELQTISQGYTPAKNVSAVTDTFGRTAPVNPLLSQNLIYTNCWNNTLGQTTAQGSVYVTVTDNCPCAQVNTTTGLIYAYNQDCCGNVEHMDLSFNAFEKLAHPNLGIMMTQIRPVDCNSKTPLTFTPGYVDKVIYDDGVPHAGWSWNPYQSTDKQYAVANAGADGGNATCVTVLPQGGLTFSCRDCNMTGYQPFADASASNIQFYIIGQSAGSVPSLQLGLGNNAAKYYCQSQQTTSLTKGQTMNGFTQFTVPLSTFDCDLTRVTDIGFQNTGGSTVQFCLDNVELTGTGSTSSAGRRMLALKSMLH
eukprot:jgi/Astpho2/903/Aster-00744